MLVCFLFSAEEYNVMGVDMLNVMVGTKINIVPWLHIRQQAEQHSETSSNPTTPQSMSIDGIDMDVPKIMLEQS